MNLYTVTPQLGMTPRLSDMTKVLAALGVAARWCPYRGDSSRDATNPSLRGLAAVTTGISISRMP